MSNQSQNMVDQVLSAVETLIDAKMHQRGTTTFSTGKIIEIHESGQSCIIENATGSFHVVIPREFNGVPVESVVIFKDLFGDKQRLYIDSIVFSDWSGGSGEGGGGSGPGSFRVVRLNSDGTVGGIVSR